jgi:hypothetical protein
MKRFLVAAACLAATGSSPAMAKGGTNMHEMASQPQPVARAGPPTLSLPPPSEFLAGCGRGRYRDPTTRSCRGPADIPR